MSYILDALRKADAERERGTVPGIHAQPMFGAAAPPSARPAPTPWPWIGAAALLLLAAALLWLWLGGQAGRGAVERPLAAGAAPGPLPAPTPVQPAAPAAPPAAVAMAPAPSSPAAEPTSARPQPAQRKVTPKAVTAASLSPAASGAITSRAGTAAPVPAASTTEASAESRVYALNELPDEIRRQLPALSVGGSMYSAKAADRILILNGQVLHEGDKVAPDLVLQQIKLKAAVLAFRNYRYSIAF